MREKVEDRIEKVVRELGLYDETEFTLGELERIMRKAHCRMLDVPTYYLKMTQKQIGPYEFPSAANFPEIDGREYCIIRNFWR